MYRRSLPVYFRVVHLHFNPGVEAHMLAAIGNKSNILIQQKHRGKMGIKEERTSGQEGTMDGRIRVVGIGLRTTFVELSVKKRCHRFRVFATLCVGLEDQMLS